MSFSMVIGEAFLVSEKYLLFFCLSFFLFFIYFFCFGFLDGKAYSRRGGSPDCSVQGHDDMQKHFAEGPFPHSSRDGVLGEIFGDTDQLRVFSSRRM